MSFRPPERFNIADYFLDQRVEEGRGNRIALRLDDRQMTYDEVLALANRFGQVLLRIGVRPEERVLIALPDGPEFVGALFGVLKSGAVGHGQSRPGTGSAGWTFRLLAGPCGRRRR
jgi:acyl-coenzyme A synthetase/AMP-(fatty) acid ligase